MQQNEVTNYAHTHAVVDTDTRFIINPVTRQIKNESSRKTVLMQGDHNSERFTFELPKTVEAHPMVQCNAVEIHYLNVSKDGKTANSGMYTVDDLREDGDKVVCSCLIFNNATQLVGALTFILRFKCVEDGVVTYAWNTAIYKDISMSDGINADEAFETEYVDIIEQWKAAVTKQILPKCSYHHPPQKVCVILPLVPWNYKSRICPKITVQIWWLYYLNDSL